MQTTAYVWARPVHLKHIPIRFADHTWVTTYPAPYSARPTPPSRYWYCWGNAHSAGPKATSRLLWSGTIDLAAATCICAPDDRQAHGGIEKYGQDGVCHQLTNRVLFATSPYRRPPAKVDGAVGYLSFSRYKWDLYGTTLRDWQRRKRRCLVLAGTPRAAPPQPSDPGDSMTPAHVRRMLKEQLGRKATPNLIQRVGQLHREMKEAQHQLDQMVNTGKIKGAEYANRSNQLFNDHLSQLAAVLGPDNYTKLFGTPPDIPIGLVDPTIAERQDYQKK